MGLAQKLQQAQQIANTASGALNSLPGGQKPGGYPAAPGGYGQQASGGYPGQQSPHQAGGYPGQQPPHQAGGYPGQQPPPQAGGFPGQHPPAGQYGAPPQAGHYGGAPGVAQYGAPPQGAAGQYGAPPMQGGPSSNAGTVTGVLQNKLRQMIQVNRLEAFYPPNSPQLNQLFATVDRVDFKAMAQRYNMPLELATDMVTLAMYDVVIFCDDSGSMAFEEGGERVNDLKVILGRVAEVATQFDHNGINIRFMNGNVEGNNIRDSASASSLVSQVQFNGLTPLGSKLDEKVIRPFVAGPVQSRSLQKPILVIVITDGEPTGEPPNTVLNVIKGIKNLVSNSQYGPGAVGIEFSQVGKDQGAQRFLATLDKDPQVGKMIDATSYYELEQEEYARKGVTLTPDLWLMKLMVGAVDPTFDEQD